MHVTDFILERVFSLEYRHRVERDRETKALLPISFPRVLPPAPSHAPSFPAIRSIFEFMARAGWNFSGSFRGEKVKNSLRSGATFHELREFLSTSLLSLLFCCLLFVVRGAPFLSQRRRRKFKF